MEAGVLVRTLVISLTALLVCACVVDTASAGSNGASRQEIRFYKANRALQTDRIWFTKKKARVAGCHDFIKKTRVFKVVQFGYQQCTLYSKKSCQIGSEIPARQSEEVETHLQLTQGFAWLPESEHKRGAKLRSWSCE